MEVQLPVDVGPRRVVESFGVPQRCKVVEDDSTGRVRQDAAEGHRDEWNVTGCGHWCGRKLGSLAKNKVGSHPVEHSCQISLHHRPCRTSEERSEHRTPPVSHRELHDPGKIARRCIAASCRRHSGSRPIEAHRRHRLAAIFGHRPVHAMAPTAKRHRHRCNRVNVARAASGRTQNAQSTPTSLCHRTILTQPCPRCNRHVASQRVPSPSRVCRHCSRSQRSQAGHLTWITRICRGDVASDLMSSVFPH